ncbi:MAG: hypothetical protein KC766_34355, partial [Myxococcales bacterium]|nr:hypothetical protein [Myxococcales bacterium]
EVALEQRFGAATAGAPEASLELAAGSLRGEFASGVELNYIRAEIAAGGRWASLGASSVALVDDDPWSTEGALAQSVRARLGSESSLHLRAALDQALGHSWRVLLPGTDALGGSRQSAPSPAPWASPFAALGTSAGGELWLPLGRSFATSVTSVFDVSAGAETPRWLFAAWGGAYRHPCGCLSLQTQLSHRLGRHSGLRTPLEAFDAFVALELFDVSSGG